MSDYDRKPTTVNVTPTAAAGPGAGLYFIVGALVVAVLVGGYLMFGAPKMGGDVARGPDKKVEINVQQPAAPAPAAPAPAATPAPRR